MKKKNLQKVLAFTLMSSLLAGMTVVPKAAEEDGPFGKYDETVTLTRAQMTTSASQ